MSNDTAAAAEPPQTAMTVHELIAVINVFVDRGAISMHTPIALYNDAEGNQLRWLMAFNTFEVNYRPDQFPHSLDEPDDGEDKTLVLALMPADD